MILDFHYTVIVAKRINDNDIIAISMEKKRSVRSIFTFTYCVFCLFLANE